jgi:hypothetical protein
VKLPVQLENIARNSAVRLAAALGLALVVTGGLAALLALPPATKVIAPPPPPASRPQILDLPYAPPERVAPSATVRPAR